MPEKGKHTKPEGHHEDTALSGLVLDFFSAHPLAEAKEMLWELYRGWTYSPPGMQRTKPADMLRFFEEMGEFMEGTYLKASKDHMASKAREHMAKVFSVQAIVSLIAEAVRPEKIYLLGSAGSGEPGESGYLDLLVVIPTSNPSSFADLEPVVELACLGSRKVSCSLAKADHVQQMLTQGHILYSLACVPSSLVYSDGSPDFCPTPPGKITEMRERLRLEFESNFSKATAFYETALQYRSGGNRELVPFMLHQAAELTLRSLLLSLLGKEKRTHSLKVLLRNVRRIAPAVGQVFPRDTEQERRLVHLLEESYLRSRYESSFDLDDEMVAELAERLKELLQVTLYEFNKRFWVIMH